MKIKPALKSGGVIVELGPRETQLSPRADENPPALEVFRLKKILAPVDFTQCSEKALLYAVAFARQFEAELTLLHILELPRSVGFDVSAAMTEMESSSDARKELETLRDRFAREVPCDTVVREGIPSHVIVTVAKELGSDLIVLATHARTGLERLILGSTAEKVVRHAGCPVLVVREIEHEFIAGSAAR